MRSFGFNSPFHCLDGTCSATNDEHLLPLGFLPVEAGGVEDVAMEFLLVRQVRYFRVTTGSHRGDDAVKSTIACVVDDPAALLVV